MGWKMSGCEMYGFGIAIVHASFSGGARDTVWHGIVNVCLGTMRLFLPCHECAVVWCGGLGVDRPAVGDFRGGDSLFFPGAGSG